MNFQQAFKPLYLFAVAAFLVACNSNDRYQEGFDTGYRQGYDQGYDEGDESGYERGREYYTSNNTFDDGFRDGQVRGLASGYASGLAVGRADGRAIGFAEAMADGTYLRAFSLGRADGYDDGETAGYNRGYNEGYDDGFDDGRDIIQSAINRSYDAGYTAGYSVGYQSGYNVGDSDGYSDGYDDGRWYTYNRGYNDGYDDGYDYGYSDGYYDGSYDDDDWGDWGYSVAQINKQKQGGYARVLSQTYNDLFKNVQIPLSNHKRGLKYKGKYVFEETSLGIKDLQTRAAIAERYILLGMSAHLETQLGLERKRAFEVAKVSRMWQIFASARALGPADAQLYGEFLIGKSLTDVERAVKTQRAEEIDSLLLSAAKVNNVTKAKASLIMKKLFY
jgi:flagellar biosynthesis/type III secretory pathway protein FliH